MRGWLRDTAGGLPATYWYLWTGILINRVGGFAVLFLSLYLTAQRGAGTAQAGLIVGTYGIGGILGTLAGGVLTDRWGRRRTLLLSHFIVAATLAGLALSPDLRVIAALCLLLGLFQSMPQPAFVAAIIDVVPVERRSRAFNLQFWAFNLGMALASLIAGVLATWSYVGLFLIDAASTLATALLIAWKIPETLPRRTTSAAGHATAEVPPAKTESAPFPPAETESAPFLPAETESAPFPPRPSEPGRGRPRGLGVVLTDRIFLVFVGLTVLQALIYTQASTIVPLAMQDDHLSPSAYGVVVSLGAALIVVGQLFVPRIIDGHRKHRILAAALLVNGLGFAVLALADHLPLYLLAAVIWTIGGMLAAPPNAEINSELAPLQLRGRYQAVFFLAFPAASFLAPALGGAGLQYLGDAHWLLVGTLGAIAAALHLLAGPARERRVAAIRSQTAETVTTS
ncbi:MDR family MFS transporter [Paractinoplanes atraurantiacus]|uniref:Predicted arabinose efflux permease, MFS family n=1 Tax=Paractinoplanes atraurantiacus TaxID=1036182 RepID=A0A285F1U7_9ACTN|nr:MFS transporter [Actinoplanes atraurantiacus]SNY05265.1 Predicted arabinose efflux permease, MFS family [Actinoplanes atraurantiacus]